MMTQKVSKSSIKVSHFWLRRLVAAIVLFFVAQGVWGETYYWIGGTTDHETEWNELSNWNTQADGTGDAPSSNLTTSDSVIIPSGATSYPVISDDSTNPVSSIEIQTGASLFITCSVDFSGFSGTTFTNNGNVYFYNQNGASEIEFKTPTGGNLGKFNFWGETKITINGDCTADTFNMVADAQAHYVTDNFDATIAKGTGNGKLTVTNGMEFSRASNTAGKTGSIIFSADVVAGSIVTHSGVIFTLYNGYKINTATYEHNAGNGDVIAKTIIFGEFKATSSFDMAVSTVDNAGSTEVSVGPTGELNSPLIKTSKRTYSNTSYSTEPFSNEGTINTKVFDIPYEVINNGTINADAGADTASVEAGSFTGTGTINLKNGTTSLTVTDYSTQNAIVLEETDSTIEGNYNLTSFTADDTTTMQGKTITLNNSEITVTTTLSLKGASGDGNSLSLAGTGTTHKFISTGLSATYLSIDSNIQLANYSTLISNCKPTAGTTSADYGKVISNGWLIKAKNGLEYTWTGASGSAWDNGANWDTTIVPGTDCKIIIPAVTNLPVLPDAACAGGTLSIESGASVQLGAADLVLSGTYGGAAGTKLSNAGTIIYTGAGRITNGTNAINDTAQGTVEYAAGSGGTVTNFGDADDYYDLKISGTNWKLDGNTFKIAHGFNLASGASCQITDTPTIQSAGFTIDGNFSVNEDKNLILTPYDDTDAFTVPDGIQNKITFNGGNGHRGWLWLGSSTYNGTITFANAATFTYKLYLNGDAVLDADVTLTNSLTYLKSLTGSKSLTFSGTGTQTFTPGTTTSAKIIVNKNSTTQGELILVGNCTLADFEVQNCKLITVNGTPTFTTYTDSAAYGTLVFTNGATFTSAFTRNSGGTTTITGDINADSVTLKDVTVNGTAIITAGASGTITLNGNVTDVATSTLNLNSPVIIGTGNHSISAGTIVFAAGATIDGDGTANLTLNPTTLVTINENVGDTTPLASFAITGPSSIKCASIKTTGNQSYSGAVNLAGTGDLSLYATGTTPQISFTADIAGTGKTLQLPSTGATAVFGDGVTVNPAIDSDGTVQCDGSVAFKDANSFTNFTATGLGGKTLTFEAGKTQTVSGDLSLSGTSTTSRLALAPDGSGTWTLNCSDPDPSVSYVNVSYSTSINEITATGSNDSGHNVKWNFPGMTYTWKTTASDSDWTNPSNWDIGSVPGKGADVTIPAATPYPVLEADLDLLYNTQGKITINGKFDLDEYKLTVSSITNNGQVLLKGTTGQITGSVTNGTNSTVEYYDDTTTLSSVPWGASYENLVIKKPVSLDSTAITVAKVTTIKDLTGKTVSLNNASNSFAGNIVLDNAGGVVINASSAITIADDAQADSLVLGCGVTVTDVTTSGNQSYSGEVTLAANAELSASGASSTISFAKNINGSGKSLTLSSGAGTTIAAEKTIYPAVINNGVLTCSGAVTFKAAYSGTGATLNLADAETTFEADVNLSGTTLNAGDGTVSIGGSGGAVIITGAQTFHDFTTTRSLVFTGANEFNDFTANVPGGTIKFPDGEIQTINGKLTLKGTAGDGNKLLLRSSSDGSAWTIKCTGENNHTIEYVDVKDGTNSSLTGTPSTAYNLFALSSNDSGHNTNWNFPGMTYTWKTAATDSSWTNASNWTPESVPGKGALVTIPAATPYPVLEADLDLLYNTQGKITVNGTFDLADNSLTVAEIQNNGTLRANGVTGQAVVNGTMKNGPDSTVEYYGTGNNNLFWDGDAGDNQYVNLILDQEINYAGDISASGNITIKKPATLNGTISITGDAGLLEVDDSLTYGGTAITTKAAQTYNSAVTISQNATFKANNGSTILFGGTVSGSAGTENLTLSTAAVQFNGNVSTLAELTTEAATINCTSVSTSGNQTYGGAVVINADTVLSSTGTDKEVYFKSTVTGDGAHSLTVSSADSRFDGTVTNLTALTTDAAQIYCTQITTTTTQTYNGDVTLYQSPELEATQITFGTDITGAGKTLSIDSPKLVSSIAASNEAEMTLDKLALLQNVEISSSNAAGLKLSVGSITGSDKSLTFAGNTTLFTLKDGITVEPAVINNKPITCAGAATFKGTFTNSNGTITGDTTNGKTLTFEKAYSGIGNLTASKGTTAFEAGVDLSGTSFTHSSGTIQFNGNGTTQALTTKADGSTHFYNITIATPAKVSTTSSFFVDGTTWTNTTNADGFVAGTTSQITFNNATITIGGKNTFNKIVFPTDSQTVSVTGSNTITDLTSTGASQNISFSSSNIFNTVGITGAGTNLTAEDTLNKFNGIITIGSTSVVVGNISLKASTTLNFAANFNCNSATLNAAANAVTFNGNAAYNTGFVNNGTAATTFHASFTGNGDASFAGDAIFQGTSGTGYQLSCPADKIIKSKNFVLYSGNYTFNGNLETAGDVIILGSGYDIDDSETGISNVYAYNQPRLSDISFTGTFPAATFLSATVTAGVNANIKVGKNFYANGTSLQGNSNWNIQLPKICDATHGFAEAINTTAKNCKVSCWEPQSNTATDDTADAKIVAYGCTDNTGNTNWNFADFEIDAAYTVRDNAVYVEFNAPVRNLHNEVNNSIAYLTYKGTTVAQTSFSGIYSQPDCQVEDAIENADVNLTDGKYKLYLKAPDTWNTDATGKTPGAANSTDRNGIHKASVPYLDIPRSLTAAQTGTASNVNYIITNKWGKRLNNYSTRTPTASHAYGDTGDANDVLDKTGPVLYSVRTGQELHTASNDEANVKSNDSHNFIEFRYSEPVNFDDSASPTYTALNTIPADPDDADQNVQVTADFGALIGDITTEGPLQFKGLGQIASGLIHTGNSGTTDKNVNSLYRRDAYSICISIAGYTNGTVTDNNGYTYKKWPGYIEQAVLPSGQVTFLVDSDNKNQLVKDKQLNAQEKYANEGSNTIPTVNSENQGLYGKWDISEPVFAIIRQNSRNTQWAQATFDTNYQAEAIGSTSGVGSSLDRVEFHLYDNTPDFDDTTAPTWFTEVGWCGDPDTSEDKNDSFLLAHNTYAADIFGGARPFTNNAFQTSGGIRYSTLQNSASAFKYGVGSKLASSAITTSFDTSIYVYGGASSLIFTGTSNPRRGAQDPEGLYFALPLTGSSYDLKTSFTVHYDDAVGFITDLAGNRLRSKTVSTIDRTPPSIDMTISPIGKDEVEIVFVKELCIDSSKLNYQDNTTFDRVNITESFAALMPLCFDIITIDENGVAPAPENNTSLDLKINTSVPARVWVEKNKNDSAFTHIRMKLNRKVKLEDLTKYYLRVKYVEKYGELSVDLFTQHSGSRVTFIQDENGNTIQMYTAHALSDFAVEEVKPLYAYDSSMTETDGTIISGGLWHKDTSDDVDTESWAVHDWNRTQTNYGTLPAGHTVAIVADTVSAANVKVYLANHPDEKSVSTQVNKDFEFETPWRIWFPDIMAPVFTTLSEKNNTKYSQNTGTLLDGKTNRFIFDLDAAITDLWKAGDQVSFIFGITNADGSPVTITHAPELDINHDKQYLTTSTKMPLFALRQTEEDNFMSLDLWSFRLKSIVAQRGGVTILNNVIDSAAGEKVVLRVDLPEESNLKVLVMTLDGNIVDYLARGVTSAGEHYYSWDGSNRNGKPVARGMYFIRVMTDGIDETRKVLVVKE